MKKIFFVLATICAITLSCTSMSINRLTTLTGHINYYGNVPFEEPAFETEDGNLFAMAVAPEASFTLEDVLSKQGYRLQLDGMIENATLSDQPLGVKEKIIIYSYKVLPAVTK